jgi:uncharacterized protein (DUF4415 family)
MSTASKKQKQRQQEEELRALASMPDEDVDTSDIPEITDWSSAERGRFYRPVKRTITIRLDADVIHWLKQGGRGYQTRANRILRRAMEEQEKSARH